MPTCPSRWLSLTVVHHSILRACVRLQLDGDARLHLALTIRANRQCHKVILQQTQIAGFEQNASTRGARQWRASVETPRFSRARDSLPLTLERSSPDGCGASKPRSSSQT